MAEISISIEKKTSDLVDWNTLLAGGFLIGMGLISIYSATYEAGMNTFFYRQLMYAGVGVFVMIATMFISERTIQFFSLPMYLVSLLLLAAVHVIGREVYGAKSWIYLGPISFQPSEIAKITTILAAAAYIARTNVRLKTIRDLFYTSLFFFVPIGFIFLEPDFGSSTVFAAILLGVLLWAGADLLFIFTLVSIPIVALAGFLGNIAYYISLAGVAGGLLFLRKSIIWSVIVFGLAIGAGFSQNILYSVAKPHQKARIETFLDPYKDPRGKGYNVIQSTLAVGSGGLTGKGFLQGTQTQLRYIPKQWTDFIFCVPTEEFGFIGGVAVIGSLCFLIWRAVSIAFQARSKFASTIAIGIATIWTYHMLINIGMAIGLMPVMGIPLPFMSAGGSSLLINMAMLGLLLNFYRERANSLYGNEQER